MFKDSVSSFFSSWAVKESVSGSQGLRLPHSISPGMPSLKLQMGLPQGLWQLSYSSFYSLLKLVPWTLWGCTHFLFCVNAFIFLNGWQTKAACLFCITYHQRVLVCWHSTLLTNTRSWKLTRRLTTAEFLCKPAYTEQGFSKCGPRPAGAAPQANLLEMIRPHPDLAYQEQGQGPAICAFNF